MPRPFRCRRIGQLPVYRSFSPDDITAMESVQMTVDEFETLRLLDDEGLTQEACASRMNIARTTVTAIYDSARKKCISRKKASTERYGYSDCIRVSTARECKKRS